MLGNSWREIVDDVSCLDKMPWRDVMTSRSQTWTSVECQVVKHQFESIGLNLKDVRSQHIGRNLKDVRTQCFDNGVLHNVLMVLPCVFLFDD